jgi:hypothetical protein
VSFRIDSYSKEEASTFEVVREKKEKELEKQRDEIFNSYMLMVPQGKEWRSKRTPQTEVVKLPEKAVKPLEAVRPSSPEMPSGFASSVPMVCDDKLPSVPASEDDEQLVDYSSSVERMNLDINVVHLFLDGFVPPKEDFAHLHFERKEATF